MSASVSCSVLVTNESSSDGSDVLGTSIASAREGQLEDHTVLLQWYAQVVFQFLLLCQRNAMTSYRHFMYRLPLSLPFTRTVTETDFILGVLACVEASWNIGKSDGVSSLSTIVVSTSGSVSTLVDSSSATSFTVRILE